jgi:hypothetical protein
MNTSPESGNVHLPDPMRPMELWEAVVACLCLLVSSLISIGLIVAATRQIFY